METNVEKIDKSVEHIGIVDNDVLTLSALSSYLTQQFGDKKLAFRCLVWVGTGQVVTVRRSSLPQVR